MNKVQMLGRLTKDVELVYSKASEPLAIAKFSIAVDRKIKRDGEPTADFFNCVAFGKLAENISKFFQKGKVIIIIGNLKTGSYEKDGIKRYTTDIIVEEFYFNGEKKGDAPAPAEKKDGDFFAVEQDLDDETSPF